MLAFALLLGLILSSLGKKYGFLASLGILTAIFLLFLPHPFNLWELGIVLSIGLNFFVSSLTCEEVNDLLYAVQAESRVCLRQLDLADQTFETMQSRFNQEKDELNKQIDPLQRCLEQTESKLKSQQVLLKEIENQLAKALEEKEKILQESLLKRQESDDCRKELEIVQKKMEELEPFAEAGREVEGLKEGLKKRDQELFNLQFQLNSALEDHLGLSEKAEKAILENAHLQELNAIHEDLSQKAQEEQILQQAIQQEMNDHIETLAREKELLETMLKRLQEELEEKRQLENETKTRFQEQEAAVQLLKNEICIKEDQLLDLQRLCEKESERCDTLSAELKAAEEELAKCLASAEKPENVNAEEEYALRKRVEAMHNQLREQFIEKSAVLDETRRELFSVQEQVSKYQKEIQEQTVYGFEETEETLFRYINTLSAHYHQLEKENEKEVELLHNLIGSLLK